ncbi:MAG: cAMP-binding protein [Candidatus Hydrogenedentota bacterium]|nr:MAG: cAMP-binding protein [Candidatus Hydrogenedentota bacterium]
MAGGIFKMTTFGPNAFVVVEGKQAKSFYIIRQGKVRLTNEIPIPGEEPSKILGPGDFFGVVSCMSGHPHIETAQTLTQVPVIEVGRDQFGVLIQKNAPIAMKIIRYFSLRLRVIDKAITQLSFHHTVEEDPRLMFDVGEYYFNKQEYRQAAYAFQKFLQYFSQDPRAAQAKVRLQGMNAPFQHPGIKRQGLNVSFNDGETIFIEHEPGSELYIIQSGRVKITKVVDQNEVLLAVLNPGDIFGEMALLENKPRSASAVAHGPVTALAINKANFETMVQAQPQLAVKLITILSERIWTAYRQLANLLIEDPVGRMYDMLLTLIQKKRIPIQPKASYTFDIGPQELMNMIGISPEKSESYIIALLEDKNFKLDEGKIICLDTAELEKQVHFYRKKAALDRKRDMARQNM